MALNIGKELAAINRLTVDQLRAKYAEVFGEPTNARHKQWLIKRIAWRLQSIDQGDLSERARARARELARDADLRLSPPRESDVAASAVLQLKTDNRLPPVGTIIIRPYKGETLQVKVLADGFEYEGGTYKSLSAVAKKITGSHCNGYLFFKLAQHGGDQ